MGEGETGDDLERRHEALRHDQKREQKQEMVVASENVLYTQSQKSGARGPVFRCFGLRTGLTQDGGGLSLFAEQTLQHRPARLVGYGQKLPVAERQAREETGAQFERSARVGNEVEPELDVALVVAPSSDVCRFKLPARACDRENSSCKLSQLGACRLGRLGGW